MKELTGGDKIQCRSLFKEPIKFKPMFKMILTCNHMPSIPPDDGGTWRRVRRVEFTSKFVDSPTQPNEFKIDRVLNYKFELWKETFMAMLLKYYIEYKATGKIVEPKEVTEYTNEYQKKNDIFADFCEGYIKEDESSSVPLQKVFAKFNEYCTMDNIKTKGINKNVFKEAMVKRYGPLQKLKTVAIWKGIALIENNNDLSDSDDDI
jgi:phage/plasmid-associated DNA primase